MVVLGAATSASSNPRMIVASPAEPVWWKHFVAGNVGGVFGLTLTYPLDTVKVRLQTRPAGTYKGILDCMSTMVRTEGVSAMYRGLLSPVLGYGLIKSTAFGSYNQCKTFLKQQNSGSSGGGAELGLLELTLCGAYAGFVQTFVRCPVEQIKVVMQARNKAGSSTLPPYSSTAACIKDVLRTEGVQRGFYRSFVPTLTREIPQYAIYYPSYEVMKSLMVSLTAAPSPSSLSPLATAFAGGIAGVAQWVPTYAIDVIKSRVSAAPPGTYKGFMHCAVELYRAEGVSVFWRGLSAAVVRAFPLHGAVFVGYEMSMKVMAV